MKLPPVMRFAGCCLTVLLFQCTIQAQSNFGFEDNADSIWIKDWMVKNGADIKGARVRLDSEIKHSGNYSLLIERQPDSVKGEFTTLYLTIPADFNGTRISFGGWLKTKEVKNYARLYLRQDDRRKKFLQLLHYPLPGMKGNQDWTRWDTTINLQEKTGIIYLGFIFAGTGKLWLDDLHIKIDGEPLSSVKRNGRFLYPALEDDTAFYHSSGIDQNSASPVQIENLSLLGKIWGFLKYYHPVIAAGQRNWDYELFRFLPAFLKISNTQDRNRLLEEWIRQLGLVAACKKCSEKELEKAVYRPDLDWISDTILLGRNLSDALLYIRKNRHQGKGFYLNLYPGVQNPQVLHEDPYLQQRKPDAGYRLLCLFRYWNLIQYWFPDKALIGEDWKKVLKEFIPLMLAADDELKYTLTTRQLIARIHDTHANFTTYNRIIDSLRGFYLPPVNVYFVNELPVVSKIIDTVLAKASGLERGDQILAVDDLSVAEIIEKSLPDLPASNRPTQLRDLALSILRSTDSINTITVKRGERVFNTQLIRGTVKQINLWKFPDFPYQRNTSFSMIAPKIGYINLGMIRNKQIDSVFDVLRKESEGLIIDCRQYPTDFPLDAICRQIYPRSQPYVQFPTGSLDYPGAFNIVGPLITGKKNPDYYRGKIVILVNANTQSSAEFHSMAFRQAPNAIVIGSTTAGADGNVSGFALPGGLTTQFSGIGVQYPDGKETQRIGIVPDIFVERTVEGIREGRDELLDRAIEWIRGKNK